MDFGTFVGVGYLLTEKERAKLLEPLIGTERYGEIMNDMSCYAEDKWFWGERVCDLDPWGDAKSIETLATLPGLADDGSFGAKYGLALLDCGVPVEEINTTWAKPNIYFITYAFC